MKKTSVIISSIMLLVLSAGAQTAGSDIYGTAVQTTGNAVAGADVTLIGDTFGQRSSVTSAAGNFRFLMVPPGSYKLKIGKGGFRTFIYKDVRMFTGKNKKLAIIMQAGPETPPLIMTGASGAIDVMRPTRGTNITKEMLQTLPTGRNPWSILHLVPGIMVDREDVGGNESGQQSDFHGFGAAADSTAWFMDGTNITDIPTRGATPVYLNTNMYEEVQVTLGTNDIGSQTGGVQLNYVSRRGGNRYSGDIYVYAEEDSWEMNQPLPHSITAKGWDSSGISSLYQYGINFGGPIIQDRLWFFGAYGIQDIRARDLTQATDETTLSNGYVKIDFRSNGTSGSIKYASDEKKKDNRYAIGAVNQAEETAWKQAGPGKTLMAGLQQEMGNLFLAAKFTYVDSGFTLDPNANSGGWMQRREAGPDWFDFYSPIRYWTGGSYYYTTDRDTVNLSLDGNYFIEDVLGGDHEIRFGIDYFKGDTVSQTLFPNQRRLFIYDMYDVHGGKEIWWNTDSLLDVDFRRISFYLSDTISFGRLTANIGLRYDRETGSQNAAGVPGLTLNGVPIFTDYLGDLTVPAESVAAAFEVFSPRLSFAYDMTGNGINILKASAARYGTQSGNSLATHRWITGTREIHVPWNDYNGNLVPDTGEWSEDFSTWISFYGFDYLYPHNTASTNEFDPGYNSPVLTEFTAAFEKALAEDYAASVSVIYKKTTNLTWNRGLFSDTGTLDSADNWYLAGIYRFPGGNSKEYYQQHALPNATYRTNYGSGTYNVYKALQFALAKKLSQGWMLDASVTFSDWKQYRDPAEYFDQTNLDYYDGGVVAPESGGSGLTEMYVNSRWQFKIATMVQLPFGVNFSGVFQAREGYVIPYYLMLYRPLIGWTRIYEPGKKFGDDRLPALWVLNLGLEKTFTFATPFDVTLLLNGYNITNNATTLKVNPLLSSPDVGETERILNPGIFQFGIRLSF